MIPSEWYAVAEGAVGEQLVDVLASETLSGPGACDEATRRARLRAAATGKAHRAVRITEVSVAPAMSIRVLP